jgi:DNA-binding NarL/FixJ family response regulator
MTSSPITVVLVEDQELIRTGLRTLLEMSEDLTVVAEAVDGLAGLAEVRAHRPDLVLMDIRMPKLDGIQATQRIVADPLLRQTKVIVLTTFDDDEVVFSAIGAGAAGFLLKDIGPEQLRAALRTVHGGESVLHPAVTARVMAAASAHRTADSTLLADLTPRERDVLAAIGRCLSNSQMAKELHISPTTSRTYVSRLLAKLNARDRTQLVAIAYETGLVQIGHADRPRQLKR